MSALDLPDPTPFGDASWRWPTPPGSDPAALLATLRAHPGVRDVVVTEAHVCVSFDPMHPPRGLAQRLAEAARAGTSEHALREVVIHVRYDGPDLEEVARRAGLSPEEMIDRHVTASYRVALVGFLPGFAYLRGLDPRLELPRRASPRPRVPAGALAIAGPYSGVYPLDSPGGWHWIGSALEFRAFSPRTGAALRLGDRVRFERVA
jgi:UPF0271 protein